MKATCKFCSSKTENAYSGYTCDSCLGKRVLVPKEVKKEVIEKLESNPKDKKLITISELIKDLQELENVYGGDVPVYLRDFDWKWDFPLSKIYIRPEEECSKEIGMAKPLPVRVLLVDHALGMLDGV